MMPNAQIFLVKLPFYGLIIRLSDNALVQRMPADIPVLKWPPVAIRQYTLTDREEKSKK